MTPSGRAALIAAALAAGTSAPAFALTGTLTAIGPVAGYSGLDAVDINAGGAIALTLSGPGIGYRAAVLDGGGVTLLGQPAGFSSSAASAINSRGEVAGVVFNSLSATTGALWSGSTVSTFGGEFGASTLPTGLSGDGSVYGINEPGGAFRYANGTLGPFPVSTRTVLASESGLTAGWGYRSTGSGGFSARSWIGRPDGGITDITPPAGLSDFRAAAINDHGMVAGTASGADGWVYDPSGASYTFDALAPVTAPAGSDYVGSLVFVSDMTNGGLVLGASTDVIQACSSPPPWGFCDQFYINRALAVWGGKSYDLNALVDRPAGLTLTSAIAGNDAGQILVAGLLAGSSATRYYVLDFSSPVPEPASVLGVGFGAAALMAWLRRRSGKAGAMAVPA